MWPELANYMCPKYGFREYQLWDCPYKGQDTLPPYVRNDQTINLCFVPNADFSDTGAETVQTVRKSVMAIVKQDTFIVCVPTTKLWVWTTAVKTMRQWTIRPKMRPQLQQYHHYHQQWHPQEGMNVCCLYGQLTNPNFHSTWAVLYMQ